MQFRLCLLALFVLAFYPHEGRSQDQNESPIWKHASTTAFSQPLDNLIDIIGSKDDKFVYTASYESGALGIFERDQETGELTLKSIYNEDVEGLGCLSLNEDETLLVGSCFKRKLVLFRRDTETGEITLLDELNNGDEVKNNLEHAISLQMSADGRFVYAPNWPGTVAAYSIVDDKLSLLHHHDGIDDCLNGAKLMATDSSGNMIFVPCEVSGVVAVFDRDPKAGHLRFLSFVKDEGEEGEINKLAGAHAVAVRTDDKFIYVVGGRFQGMTAINVFGLEKETGQLNLVQAWTPEEETFQAGNHIAITADGKYLIASGAKSKTLICFSIDDESGEIQFKEILKVDDNPRIGMISGLHFSADGKFLYAGDETNGRVYCFQRTEE